MEPVNELDYTLQFLEAHGIKMHKIAADLELEYDYIKGQKTQKDPQKQSKKLLRNVKKRYAAILKDMPPYKYTSNETNEKIKVGETEFVKLSELADEEEDRQEMAIENNQLLHLIKNKLQAIEGNQQALAKYVAKKDSNGDEKLEKEILEQIKKDADSYNANTDTQEPTEPQE